MRCIVDDFVDAVYRYIDGAKIGVNAVFGSVTGNHLSTATSVDTALYNEKERAKKAFACEHSDCSAKQKADFNKAWENRDPMGPAGPHIPGSPRVFS